jgi:hypothetical protein
MLAEKLAIHAFVRRGQIVRSRGFRSLHHESVGLYRLEFAPGENASLEAHHFSVTILNADTAHCAQIWSWDPEDRVPIEPMQPMIQRSFDRSNALAAPPGQSLQVAIFDHSGRPANADFMLAGQRVSL